MATDENLDRQNSINLSIQERLALLERERGYLSEEVDLYKRLLGTNLDLSQVRSRYQSDEKDILQTIRTNTNILKDQSKQITFQVAEKSRIQKISNDILSISENSYSMLMEELGTSRNISDIEKKREILAKRLIELESFRGTIIFEDKELQAAFNEELENSIKGAADLEAQLTDTQNVSEKIQGNVSWFEALKETSNKIGLGKFTSAFKAAEEAARETAVANELSKKVANELVAAKEEEAKAISTVQTAEEELQKFREENKQAMLDENKQRNDIKNSLKEKESILSKITQLSQEELETGEGLTAERLKALGLENQTKGLAGTAAKEKLKAIKAQLQAESEKDKISLNNLEYTKKERNEKLKSIKDTLNQAKQDKITSGNRVKGLKGQQQQLAKMTGKAGMKGLQAGAKALGPALKKALGPISIVLIIKDAIKFIVDAAFSASKRIAEFQKSLGVSRDVAKGLNDRIHATAAGARELTDTIGETSNRMKAVAKSTNQVQVTAKAVMQSFSFLNKTLGTNIDLTQDLGREGQQLLASTSILRDNFGLSEKALAGLTNEAIRTNKQQDEIVKGVLGEIRLRNLVNNTAIDEQQVLEDVFNLSDKTRAMFGFQTKELANAVYEARKLGFNLEDLNSSADGLLDFENSIAKELEAELILGKDLNLEKARQFALENDLVGVAKELRNQNVDIVALSKESRVAAQAYAEAVGTPLETLVKQEESLRTTEALQERLNKQIRIANALTGESNLLQQKGGILYDANGNKILSISDLQTKSLEELKSIAKDAGIEEELLSKMMGDRLYNSKLAEDAQTKFNKALETAKEQFANLVGSGVLVDIVDTLADFMVGFSESSLFKMYAGTEAERLANRQLQAQQSITQAAEVEASNAKERLKEIKKDLNQLSSSSGDPVVAKEIERLKSEKDTLQKQIEEASKKEAEAQTNQQRLEKDKESVESYGGAKGGLAGAAAGAAVGATIGSIIPVLGTGIGAAIGAAIGGITGYQTGESLDDKAEKEFLQKQLLDELSKSEDKQDQQLIKNLEKTLEKFEFDPSITSPKDYKDYTTTNISDAIIRPNQKQIVVPDEQDVIAAFKPDGIIDKTLSTPLPSNIPSELLGKLTISSIEPIPPLKLESTPITPTIEQPSKVQLEGTSIIPNIDVIELAKTNVIAAESYAKAMGTSLEELLSKQPTPEVSDNEKTLRKLELELLKGEKVDDNTTLKELTVSLDELRRERSAPLETTTIIDNSELVKEIIQLRKELNQLNNRPVQVESTINLDGNKVATALGMSSYTVGS